jgi:hypothetical protein
VLLVALLPPHHRINDAIHPSHSPAASEQRAATPHVALAVNALVISVVVVVGNRVRAVVNSGVVGERCHTHHVKRRREWIRRSLHDQAFAHTRSRARACAPRLRCSVARRSQCSVRPPRLSAHDASARRNGTDTSAWCDQHSVSVHTCLCQLGLQQLPPAQLVVVICRGA